MAACNPLCGKIIPAIGFGCNFRVQPGGICRLVFMDCATPIPQDPVLPGTTTINLDAWQPLIDACKLRISPKIKGQMPESTTTEETVDSCGEPIVTSTTHTVTFLDYNSTPSLADYKWWQAVYEAQGNYKVGWYGTDGRFYGFYQFSLKLGEIIDDHKTGKAYKSGTITIQGYNGLLIPAYIDGLQEALLASQGYDCTVGGYTDAGYAYTSYEDFFD